MRQITGTGTGSHIVERSSKRPGGNVAYCVFWHASALVALSAEAGKTLARTLEVKRLLSVNNYFYRRGGADVLFFEHDRLFREIGWETAQFAMRHQHNEHSDWSRYFVNEIEFDGDYSALQKAWRGSKAVYSFEARSKLASLLDEFNPDLVHAHNIYHHLSPSILGVMGNRGTPTVMTLHDLKLACPAYKMLREGKVCEACKEGGVRQVLANRCMKSSWSLSAVVYAEAMLHKVLNSYEQNITKFIVPSRFYREKLLEWGKDGEKIAYVPNFVDVEKFEPGYEPGRVALYFGRLSSEKGVDTLIRAAALANVELHLIGTGPEEETLRELATELGACVEFKGYMSGNGLHEAVRSARTVVLPSEWFENAPLSVMEAYALGKPVVGAGIGGIPELIKEAETGFTFESGSVDALAGVLSRVATLPDAEVERMGRRGRSWMDSNFSVPRYRERILELYGQLEST